MWLRRKAVAVALTGCALAVASTACGGSGSNSGSSSQSGKVEGEISFWYPDDEPNAPKFWPGFVKEFEAKYPGTKVKLTGYAPDLLAQKLLSSYAAGGAPDVFYTNGGHNLFKFARRGLVLPLDGRVDFTPYRQDLLKAFVTDEGKTYGVPTLVAAPYVLWYNQTVLDKVGAKAPATWDELLSFCDTVSQNGITPISLGNADQWEVLMWFDNLVYQYGGPDVRLNAVFDQQKNDWTDPAFGKAIGRLNEMIDHKCFQDNFNGIAYDGQTKAFFTGRAASTALGDWLAGDAKKNTGKDFDLKHVNLPPVPDGAYPVGNGGGMMATVPALSANAKSGNAPVATAFLSYFGKRVEDFNKMAGRIPPTTNPPAPSDPQEKSLFDDVEKAGAYYGVSDVILPSALWDDLYTAVQAVTLGKLDAAGFGSAMNDAVKKEQSELNK